jgi:PAS domain S-box-containing protein
MWLQTSAAPLRDGKGRIQGATSVIADITELRHTEAALRFGAERWERLINSIQDAVIIGDIKGRVVAWNSGAEQMFGWRAEEVLTRRFPPVPSDDMSRAEAVFRRVIETGDTVTYEAERLTKGGKRFPVLGTASALIEDGEVCGLVTIMKDISELRQLEQRSKALAVVEERDRIAMDLHDGVIQTLYGVGMSLSAVRRSIGADRKLEQRALAQSITEINRSIDEIRDYVFKLRLSGPADQPLTAAIRLAADALGLHSQIQTRLDLDDAADGLLSGEVGASVLQVAREAMSNIVRHAAARHATIRLSTEGDGVVLTVTDDGQGFSPTGTGRRAGDGLRNMAERARSIGGQLGIASHPSQGTEVRLQVPSGRDRNPV